MRSTYHHLLTLALVGLLCLSGRLLLASAPETESPALATSVQASMPLEQGWRSPPAEAQVHCWWWWLNGNVTKQAITRDLEAMRAKGIGGANIIDAAHASQGENSKPPHGPDFGSPAWRELFVHALREADRLGLELGFNIQSGWNLGGPTVTPEQAAKRLTFAELTVEGGRTVRTILPQPERHYNYYQEVKVLAFPLPADRQQLARVANYRQKAYYSYPGGFTAVDATHLLQSGEGHDGEHLLDPDQVIDITAHAHNGRLAWEAPPGSWRVLRIGYTLSGAHVSTSSDNWKGLAIDYLDASAFEQYCDDVLTPILDAAGPLVGKSLRFLHTDSWELGPVNWTPAMPERFQQRRGYDMTPYLPALAGYAVGGHENATRFLNDFRRTIADLIADGKYAAFSKYSHLKGLGIHPESGGPHAAPVDALLCLGRSDIPMGEFWARSNTHRTQDSQRLFVKQASSAAHIYGRRYVMAEAFTTIGPHWERDPHDLKPVFDRVACEGLNRVMWHTFDCSPDEFGKPGLAYFAGTHLNPNVTWWDQADGFLGYLNRCQFLLQQGLPVADVLYFYGENVPSFVRLKNDNPANVPEGYDYDVTNLEVLVDLARVEDRRLVLPDGMSYAVLALPPSGHYGLAALRKIAELADQGLLVVGEKPAAAIGLFANGEQEAEFHELAERLWSTGAVKPIPASQALRDLSLRPDFSYSDLGDHSLDYFHRRTTAADIYFVVNRRNRPCRTECAFRVEERLPRVWDPVYGTMHATPALAPQPGVTSVELNLPPNGSAFVVFDKAAPDQRGDLTSLNARAPTVASRELTGPWTVRFDPRWGGPEEVTFDSLIDWSASSDDRIRYYSGAASYEQDFELSATLPETETLWLDLGRVKNTARVTLNGVDLGVAWTSPFRVNLTPASRPGTNRLRIEVINLWPNRLIRDAGLPRAERLTKTNITKFKPSDRLLPAGLMGPVRLVTEPPHGSPQVTTQRMQDDAPASIPAAPYQERPSTAHRQTAR